MENNQTIFSLNHEKLISISTLCFFSTFIKAGRVVSHISLEFYTCILLIKQCSWQKK